MHFSLMTSFPTRAHFGYALGVWCAGVGELAEQGGAVLQFGDQMVEILFHDPFAQELNATHLGLHQTMTAIAAPIFP